MKPERRVLRGVPASHGMAVGPVKVLRHGAVVVPMRRIEPSEFDGEELRLRAAIDASRQEIESVRDALEKAAGTDYGLILDAHLLMHRDELVVDGAVRAIREEGVNAEWALRRTIDDLKRRLGSAGAAYFQDRALDVEHVGQHILRWLMGAATPCPPIDASTILVCDDLTPADAAKFLDSPVIALVTELGSAASHTAILARTLEIPAVVGVTGVMEHVVDDDVIVVDALHGLVVLEPDRAERFRAQERARRYQAFLQGLRSKREAAVETKDGERVCLQANVEFPAEAPLAIDAGADGIGLYRTEFLFLDRPSPPSEDEQAEVYSQIVRVMNPRTVTFRTYDLGGDKLPGSSQLARSPNPALGLRALRLSLAMPELFEEQLRAILRASCDGPTRLMFPLVSNVDELRRARAIVARVVEELRFEGTAVPDVPVGIMVEVPSAALVADVLARECEFFSVGTNDLIQYTLALDRTNPQVAYLARPLEPAILRLLDMVSRAARAHGIDLAMCGDMAADPFALPVVVGLGYRNLSMAYASIPLAREVLGRIDSARAHEVAAMALECDSADSVHRLVLEHFSGALGDLWIEEGLELEAVTGVD